MTGFEVYALAVGGPVVLVGLVILGFCRAAAGRDYEQEQLAEEIEKRRGTDFMRDHRFDWPVWQPVNVQDRRTTSSGSDAQTSSRVTSA